MSNTLCQGCLVFDNQMNDTISKSDVCLINLKHGEKLFSENKQANRFYCIKKGRIILTRKGDKTLEEIIYVATSGDVIGIDSLVFNNKYHNSARSFKDAVVCKIDKKVFMENSEKTPKVVVSLLNRLISKIKTKDIEQNEVF